MRRRYRVVERVAQRQRRAGGQQLEADQAQLLGRAAQLSAGRLGRAQGQRTLGLDARVDAVQLVGDVVVDRLGDGDGELLLLALGPAAGAGREQHRRLEILAIDQAHPALHLLLRADLAPLVRLDREQPAVARGSASPAARELLGALV